MRWIARGAYVAVLVLAAVGVALLSGAIPLDWLWEERGRQEARRDMADDNLQIRRYGHPGHDVDEDAVNKAWEDQLGVKQEWVAGCIVDAGVVSSADAYNAEMRREIDRRFGPQALERIARRVRDERAKASRPKPVPD